MHHGSCLCGAVSFTVDGPLLAPDACHCTQCRKSSGHFSVSTDVPKRSLAVTGADRLTWFHTSQNIRRGFCSTCGSQLFWEPTHLDWIGVEMGAFHGPTGTRIAFHIFVADKGDYYELEDGLPQYPQRPTTPSP